jgi:hypothetical protein
MMGYDVLRGFDVIESISKTCTCILFVPKYCNYLSKSFTSWFYLSVDVYIYRKQYINLPDLRQPHTQHLASPRLSFQSIIHNYYCKHGRRIEPYWPFAAHTEPGLLNTRQPSNKRACRESRSSRQCLLTPRRTCVNSPPTHRLPPDQQLTTFPETSASPKNKTPPSMTQHPPQ